MKKYQKAQMIAKNLPTGSYAAGCPVHTKNPYQADNCLKGPGSCISVGGCSACEVAK